MGFLARLLDMVTNKPVVQIPDDTEISRALVAAKRANKRASKILNEAVKKQENDALFVRQVISDVLDRAEKGKSNAGNH